jgi:hypothetical protein
MLTVIVSFARLVALVAGLSVTAVGLSLLPLGRVHAQTQTGSPNLSAQEMQEIATSAYIYAYPLIMMELTRRASTNVADTQQFAKAPMNQFSSVPAFPDASFTEIARPNADTLYSLLWFDVSNEPLLITVPDSGGRYEDTVDHPSGKADRR